MPTYDNPQRERYLIPALSFAAASNRQFQGPPGKKGLVRDIVASITTAMVGTTTVPEIVVGTAAGDSSFARWRLGTAIVTGNGTGELRARFLCSAAPLRAGDRPMQLLDYAGHVFLEGNNASGTASIPGTATTFTFIPADTAFFISAVAGVGTPAGVADINVDIDWF